MTPHELIAKNLGLLLVAGFLTYFPLRKRWVRRRMERLFSRHSTEVPTLETINQYLSALNAESPKISFGAYRRANVLFRGQIISFVYGLVSGLEAGRFGPRWRMDRQLFAISDLKQADWMTKNGDVFTLALKGTSTCVFWTNVTVIEL